MEETKFSLRLLVDEKKNKVVLAEACRDFVDVLFSLLTLPMGTIVRLLEKHNLHQMRLGCFHNIYKSVSDMTIHDFETEACRTMLLYPKSTKEIHCRRLKLNIDDTEATKFFICPLHFSRESCKKYSNFNTSRCSCGNLMTNQFQVSEEDQIGSPIGNNEDGVFVSCRSSYIITDNLRVTQNSLGVIANELNVLGYADCNDLQEFLLDVGYKEVLALLGNFFASEFPLSLTFLSKHLLKWSLPHAVKDECVKGGHECNVKIFVRKFDRKILYAECSQDFIDSLLGLLVLPLDLAWSLTNNSPVLGCVGNLCRSECREASASTPWEIPYYYTCMEYSYPCSLGPVPPVPSFVRHVQGPVIRIIRVIPMDPKVESETPSKYGFGFVKRGVRFIVSDDLVITPMSSSSTIGLFMKSKINNMSDFEEQEINISKAEVCFLKLLIDEEQNRVVLAETCKDFADVLCSLLTLPMGTIVRLLEKHHQNPQSSSIVGCFHNLYKSVSDMDIDNFKTPGCKNLLMHPRSMKESHCRKLKLNVDDTEATKFFVCPNFVSVESCCKVYSNVSTSRCSCGNSMAREFQVEDGEKDKVDGVFLSCRTSYIVTDDMRVAVNSMGLVLNVLNDLGYSGFDKLQEMVIDVGFEEVLTLLGCLFTSDAPLTDTFLRKHCMAMKSKMLTPLVQETRVAGEVNEVVTLKVYVRKSDKAILYAECREEFVDFLFTFLVIPLEFAWELSVDDSNMGCVGNLRRSVKELSFEQRREAMLPYYYSCRIQLLDVVIQETPEYECLVSRRSYNSSRLSKTIKKSVLGDGERVAKLTPVVTSDSASIGLVKGETNFIVSDDLVVTAMNSSSTISLLSKLQMNISDIEEQVISIGKAQAISLLRASLITTSALSNGLSNFLSKMKLKEAAPSTFKIPKSEKIL
ncbi:hypothetical protein Bca52824_067111 [Brassica carinata]|uniref:Uncharacterized protein n=1 Tax=Brassica carinata TaxID=52824 RepID=A0A8X7UE14_BRACI|nr:hypothetical protein Bca52824_067111 [Brassica carinata]